MTKTKKGKPTTLAARVAKMERMVEFLRKNSNNMVKRIGGTEGLVFETASLASLATDRVQELGPEVSRLSKNLMQIALVLQERKIVRVRLLTPKQAKGGDPKAPPQA